MKAAVMRAYKTPLSIEEVEIGTPGPHEVLVRTRACGVCHSDLHVLEGALPVPPPCVLGHEPAGIVEEVGREITYLKPGDPVIACLSVFCGACDYCLSGRTNLCGGAATARKLGMPQERVISTVAEHANTSAASVPLALAVAMEDGRIKPGDLVMLQGVGGGFTWGANLVRM